MKKSTLLSIVALVLAMALGVSGTIAYLTDTDSDVNVMVLGSIKIDQHEQDRDGNDFDQYQTLLPIVGGTSEKDANGYPSNGNYIDKIVTVENTGKNDAYVRTFIAVPVYAYEGQEVNNASANVIHWNGYSKGDETGYPAAGKVPGKAGTVANNWSWGKSVSDVWPGNGGNWNSFKTVIDGMTYEVFVVTNTEAVQPGEITAPNMIGIYLDSKVDYDHDAGKYTYDNKEISNFDGTVKVLVATQAVQYDSGWKDAFDALDTAFGAPAADKHPWIGAKAEPTTPDGELVKVENSAALESALTSNKENIYVELAEDVTFDVTAWANGDMGGDTTKAITIIGNGNTLTFNQTNSDWNNISTANGATLVLKNVNLTNSGYNNGPWNRHDLNFACDVRMENVTSDKALAFKAGAVLENVTINDANTSDTYAIWIQPNGQTVSLNNVTIDMLDCTDGRGIKIDEQYVSAPEKVTLKVSNTTFKTEEKSAILVKSVAGADIVLNNVNISGVAADSTNPVWVDEASAAYEALVNVTGGSKIVEP